MPCVRGATMKRLLLAILAIETVAGLPPHARAQDEAEAQAARFVEKAGGTITRDPKQKGNPVVVVNLSARKILDEDLNDLAGLTALQALDISFTPVTDAGLRELSQL